MGILNQVIESAISKLKRVNFETKIDIRRAGLLLNQGYKIKRKNWEYPITKEGEFIRKCMNERCSDWCIWNPTQEDLMADDWELIDGHDFAWAMSQISDEVHITRVAWLGKHLAAHTSSNNILMYDGNGNKFYILDLIDYSSNDWIIYTREWDQ